MTAVRAMTAKVAITAFMKNKIFLILGIPEKFIVLQFPFDAKSLI